MRQRHGYELWLVIVSVLCSGNAVESFFFDKEDQEASAALEASLPSVEFLFDFPYIFAEPNNIDASAPVMDHIVPDTVSVFNQDKPTFLYDGHQPNRLVLFYGDYCDTMKDFKPRFIQWAKGLQEQAETNNEFVMIFAVSCRPNRQLCLDQAVHGFPVVRLFQKNEITGKDLTYKDLTFSKVFRELGFEFQVEHDQNAWTMAKSSAKNPPSSPLLDKFSLDYLRKRRGQSASTSVIQRRRSLMDDIHLSLDFTLRNSLFTEKKPLSRDRKRHFLKVGTTAIFDMDLTFPKFLRLMIRTLPATWALQELLRDLLKDFEYITDRDTYLFLVLDRYPPQQKTWSLSCTKGKVGYGYSCGMWKLYHAISVGLVKFNTEINEEKRYSTNDASKAIKDFIADNEQCIDCRENSLLSFDRCEYGRCHILSDVTKGSATSLIGTWAQLSIWLVEWHNGINKMVLERRTLREGRNVTLSDELDVLWPPRSDCLPCWQKDEESGQYKLNPTMTFHWLKAEYGPNDAEVRKVEKYIMSLHSKESRKAKRSKLTIQISQSSIVALVMAGIWRGTRAKPKHAARKKDDGDSSSNDDTTH